MVVSRRKLLLTGASLMPLVLVACNGNANQVAAVVAADATIIANGLSGALTQISTLNISGLTTDKLQTIQLAVTSLKNVATALSGATSIAAAQPLVQQIATDLNAVVGALAQLPLPPQIALPLQAAAILLPVIETAVQLAITQINVPQAPTATTAAMSDKEKQDWARSVLVGASKH